MLASQTVPVETFWTYVKKSNQDKIMIDRDRAMEYVRRNCVNARVFKLFMLGASIAFNQVRREDQEVLSFYADFHLDEKYNCCEKEIQHVVMKVEIKRENPTKRTVRPASHFYEFSLVVSLDGQIVDVDFTRLANQIQRNMRVLV